MPAAISFTLETDGRLPSGQTAAAKRSSRSTRRPTAGPAYYMINCAHPTHFAAVLDDGGVARSDPRTARQRVAKSHAELDEAEELDNGDPDELGAPVRRAAASRLPTLNVLGGCCGTDHRHVPRSGMPRDGSEA